MFDVLLVGAGGFLGAITRYSLGGWIAGKTGPAFPYETLIINATGCFAIGLFMTMAVDVFAWPPAFRLFIAVGFLGGYTTFSTFGYESIKLIESGNIWPAIANAVGSVVIGLFAVWLGIVVGRVFA
jgi:fluoride exporter